MTGPSRGAPDEPDAVAVELLDGYLGELLTRLRGDAPGASASAADCASWQALYPGAKDCDAAAAQDAVHYVIVGSTAMRSG